MKAASLVKAAVGAVVGSVVAEKSAGRGLLGAGLGVLATRLATRSLPGAAIVGGALVAKAVYDRRKESKRLRDNPSQVIVDQKAD
jgi:hypothetical protein